MLVGVDIGGTFTDLIRYNAGELRIHKLLSTPEAPARAMLAGLAALNVTEGARIAHGSTVATNAILERKGARTALITTQGFRDILAIGRQERPVLYALQPQLPAPLIPRQWCYEVPERLDFAGNVLVPLDMAALDAVIDDIAAQGVESVAVCFLYSFVNPAHEQVVRQHILERGVLAEEQISLSCEILPEFREYERAGTVALNAYVRPIISRYLGRLEADLPQVLQTPSAAGKATLLIMKSDGGVVSASVARRQAVHTALSGPAAGVVGAFRLAQQAGFDQLITLDIGGTSTDVALCPGEPILRTETDIDGLPLRVPVIDINTVGAGGGSLARLDTGGSLRVGPQSVGANPGPIVYGRGGQTVTVTDANVLLGRIDPNHFLGGAMALDLEPARSALDTLAGQMGIAPLEAARGIVAVANANIVQAVRRVSVERGYDPADFTLVAFGGAGPLHACEVATQLGIRRVLVPRYPGVLCAYGLLTADIVHTYSRTDIRDATDEALAGLRRHLDEMIATAQADLRGEGIDDEHIACFGSLDMRYRGQSYELTVPFTEDVVAQFHASHRRRYGFAVPQRAVEAVTLRVQAVGTTEKPVLDVEPVASYEAQPAGTHQLPLDDSGEAIALYEREQLAPGARFAGPALVVQLDCTVFVSSGWKCVVDGYKNITMAFESAS